MINRVNENLSVLELSAEKVVNKVCNLALPASGAMDVEFFHSIAGIGAALCVGEESGGVYLASEFSLQMLADEAAIVTVLNCEPEDIPESAVSIISDFDTAAVIGDILGRKIPVNRAVIPLEAGDTLYVACIDGELPECAKTLPLGYKLSFRKVVVN